MARQRATVVVSGEVDDVTGLRVAEYVVQRVGALGLISWEVSDRLPDRLDIATQDQLTAAKRDSGADACYMIIWMVSNDEDEDGNCL